MKTKHMKSILAILTLFVLTAAKLGGLTIDNLKLTDQEIPKEYSIAKENNCISIQACTFYDSPEMYEMFIGKVKNKAYQSFESANDKGSIMYFEFENGFKGQGFLDGLLWGGDKKPTKMHPEKYLAKGNFLVIWSFNKGSEVEKILEDLNGLSGHN